MNAPWVVAEAYKYRRLRECFAVSKYWKEYDVFFRQKVCTWMTDDRPSPSPDQSWGQSNRNFSLIYSVIPSHVPKMPYLNYRLGSPNHSGGLPVQPLRPSSRGNV